MKAARCAVMRVLRVQLQSETIYWLPSEGE